MMDSLPTCDGCGDEINHNGGFCQDCQTPDYEPQAAADLGSDDRKGGRK